MLKVDSRKTLRLITYRFMKANRSRNIIAVMAVIMTAVLFTSLFTASASVVKSQQQQEMRQTMDAGHIAVQDLTKEQFEQVRTYKNIERYGYTIFLTTAENWKLRDTQTELRYADNLGAEGYMCVPTTGRMPKAENEIAMSTITMDQLGISRKLGTIVNLEYTLAGKKQSRDFVLTGYWKGDPLFMAQQVWMSKSFAHSNARTATLQSLEQGDYEGGYNLCIWCRNLLKLDAYAEDINQQYGLSKTAAAVSANPAVNLFQEDAFPFGSAAALLGIIFVSGYLIIYNVFHISVANDIRAYGLLKNIGTTSAQLKQIVRRQALILSVAGIPAGLAVGYCIGRAMTPYLLSDVSRDTVQPAFNTHPIIFAVSALFSLVTVYAGCMRPCRIAARIVPVEAVRMTDAALDSGEKTRVWKKNTHRRSSRSSRKITPLFICLGNLRRTWKKAVLVVISLALPIVVLNAACSIARSFHFDHFVDTYCTFDFDISGCTSNLRSSNLRGITPEVQKALKANPDVESVALIYDSEVSHILSDRGYETIGAILKDLEKGQYLKSYDLKNEVRMLESRQIPSHVMGMNEEALKKIQLEKGSLDYEAFRSGKYVLAGKLSVGKTAYIPGDKVTLTFENGKSKEYTVLDGAEIPYDMGYPFGTGTYFDCTFVLPDQEYLAMESNCNAMAAGVTAAQGKDEALNQWISSYIEESDKSLYVQSRLAILEECKGFAQKYYVILGSLCAVLFLIGLLNFYNTSSVILAARKKELSLLEAVGMTKKQIKRMLAVESLIYLASAVFLADTVGMLIARILIEHTVGHVFFFTTTITVWPSIAITPCMLAIALAVPIYHFKKLQKETIVQRLQCQ